MACSCTDCATSIASDEDVVNAQRRPAGRANPSVETLLHAYLPHKFVDHTHSTPFLVLANQPDAETLCRVILATGSPLSTTSCPVFSSPRPRQTYMKPTLTLKGFFFEITAISPLVKAPSKA